MVFSDNNEKHIAVILRDLSFFIFLVWCACGAVRACVRWYMAGQTSLHAVSRTNVRLALMKHTICTRDIKILCTTYKHLNIYIYIADSCACVWYSPAPETATVRSGFCSQINIFDAARCPVSLLCLLLFVIYTIYFNLTITIYAKYMPSMSDNDINNIFHFQRR